MKEKISKVRARLFDANELSIKIILFNIITIAGLTGGIASLLASLVIGMSPVQNVAIILAIFVLVISFYLANWKGKIKLASVAIVGVITLLLFPVMFFTGGGAYSGMGYWFAIGLLFNFLLIEGGSFYRMLILQVLAIVGCYLADYYFPEKITTLETKAAIYFDMLQSLFVLAFSIGLIIRFQNKVYKKAMDNISKQNRELEESKLLADSANRSKSEFLSNMSHEIRTPINAVLGMNEMILKESREENIQEYASNAYNAGKALLSLINDILDISKIEAGKTEIVETEYDIYSLVSDCYHMTAERAEKRGLLFTVSVEETLPIKLLGDMFRIRQIVVNLLTNAIKYTDEGSVELIFSGERKGDILSLKVSVKDTGIGMTKESMEKMFNSFQRFDLRRNQSVEGTGLGLAICKQLTELMGGIVEAESTYGEGSTFSCTIPQKIVNDTSVGKVNLTHFAEHRTLQKNELFIAPSARILVVDDVEMNLVVFQSLLKEHWLMIDEAKSGEQCLNMIKKQKYDIIFMDHMMPEMDGMETFAHMQKMEHCNGETPVVMLTANAISGEREKYLAAGFVSYLTKPIQSEKLEETLLQYLPQDKVLWAAEDENEEETIADNVIEEMLSETGTESADAITEEFSELLDVKLGLSYIGNNESAYLDILESYLKGGSEKQEEIGQLCREEAWQDYITKVHALKSTSLTVGAQKLSEAAKELEMAGKAGDYEKIKEKNDALLAMYEDVRKAGEEVRSRLKGILSDNSSKAEAEEEQAAGEEITKEQLEAYAARIREAAEGFDTDAILSLCAELSKYRFGEIALKTRIQEIEKAAADFECEQAEKDADRIFAELLSGKE